MCFREYSVLPNTKNQKIHFMGNSRIKFDIYEFSNLTAFGLNRSKCANTKSEQKSTEPNNNDILLSADAFLLCFSIASRSSLLNAVTFWFPVLAKASLSTP